MGGKSKKNVKKWLKKVANIKTWQLVLVLIPLSFLAATFLRFDHIKMTELKDAVLTADKEGDEQKIAESLNALQQFTFSHIVFNVVEENGNQKIVFGTGKFYLENLYIKKATEALQAAESKIVDDSNPNGNVYGQAGAVCRPKAIANGWDWNTPEYIECMLTEINKYPVKTELDEALIADLPSTELFSINYASPIWAPTLAGFTILLCAILIVVIFIRVLIWIVLRITLIFLKNS